MERNRGGKKARGERAPAAYDPRSGLEGARFLAHNPRLFVSYAAQGTQEALLSALSLKNRDGKIIVVDKLELEEAKTKLMAKALAELKVTSALIVIPQPDEKIERSSRNIPALKVLRVEGLNVYDLLRYEHLILTEGALKLLEERLAA